VTVSCCINRTTRTKNGKIIDLYSYFRSSGNLFRYPIKSKSIRTLFQPNGHSFLEILCLIAATFWEIILILGLDIGPVHKPTKAVLFGSTEDIVISPSTNIAATCGVSTLQLGPFLLPLAICNNLKECAEVLLIILQIFMDTYLG
jgi:hypothetical protein